MKTKQINQYGNRTPKKFTGKVCRFSMSVPESLLTEIDKLATAAHLSRNDFIIQICRREVKAPRF